MLCFIKPDRHLCSAGWIALYKNRNLLKGLKMKCQDGLPFYKRIIFNPKWQNYSVAKGRWYFKKRSHKIKGLKIWCTRNLRNTEDLWTLEPLRICLLFLSTFQVCEFVLFHLSFTPTVTIQTVCQEDLWYTDEQNLALALQVLKVVDQDIQKCALDLTCSWNVRFLALAHLQR